MRLYTHIGMAAVSVAAIVLALCISETAAASDDGMTRNCRSHFKQWKKMANNKAFAMSPVKDGFQGCGYSWAWESREKAINAALRECVKDAQRFFRTERPSCRLVKVN